MVDPKPLQSVYRTHAWNGSEVYVAGSYYKQQQLTKAKTNLHHSATASQVKYGSQQFYHPFCYYGCAQTTSTAGTIHKKPIVMKH